MRLAITKSGHYHADVYCSDARVARKILREKPVSVLAIDFHLSGNANGGDVLQWAHDHHVLPSYVVIIARERSDRLSLAEALEKLGFRSTNNATYFRH